MLFGTLGQFRPTQAVLTCIRTATKRASGGKSANKNTAGRRLGPKKGEGEYVEPGQIIWRQRGTSWYPGENVGIGRDHTLYAQEPGFVRYYRDPFHARRRFIGIALGKEERLPTPHFAPRRRRFGFIPIDNDEISEFEFGYLTRKETQRAKARDIVQSHRAVVKEQRIQGHKKILADLVPNLESIDAQAERLDAILAFVQGGTSFIEARDIVTKNILQDLAISKSVGTISENEYSAAHKSFVDSCEQVDNAVMIGPANRVCKALSLDELSASQKAAEEEIVQIVSKNGAEGATPEVVESVNAILAQPIFSPAAATRLRRKYLRRPVPVLLENPEKVKEFEKRARKGDGEIRKVWDYADRKVRQWFVPPGAKLIFE